MKTVEKEVYNIKMMRIKFLQVQAKDKNNSG